MDERKRDIERANYSAVNAVRGMLAAASKATPTRLAARQSNFN
jgi:hypothetical protein